MRDRLVMAPAPRLAVPAYFRPDARPGDWELLARSAPVVSMVILNVASGPGPRPDPVFTPAIRRLREAGVEVAGYVDTDYGRRRGSQALADLERYLRWYDVTGVCFDQAAGTADQLRYYAALARGARSAGVRSVVFNHGAHPLEAYAEHADLLGTFEGPWRAYTGLRVPRWTRGWPARMFQHLVYSVPPQNFGAALALAMARHAGCVYITDRGGANPYDQLPGPLGGETA
jgi:Spherulation-specific family 4